MTRIATSRKMGQLRARHFSTVEICLPFSECVFKSDIIQGLVGIPRWGLWLPRQHWRQTQPMKWMCQITQCHPLGESCRCVCVCGCQCVQYVCADIEDFISTAVNMLLPIFLLTLSLIFLFLHIRLCSLRPLSCSFFFFFFFIKCNLSSSTSVSHRHDLPVFSFFYFESAIIWTTLSFPII